MLIGLSLSRCIIDILKGEVQESDVIYLITGTFARNAEAWLDVFEGYRVQYWSEFPIEDVRVVYEKMLPRVIQARALGLPRPFRDGGHWAVIISKDDI